MTTVTYEQHSGCKAYQGRMPEHVAIIMDGNGRWALDKGLSRSKGHFSGKDTVTQTVKACLHHGISTLTLFAFGIENWKRPPKEVRFLFRLLFVVLHREIKQLSEQGVCLKVHGRRDNLPQALVKAIDVAQAQTQHNQKLHLNIMFNYSGRWDIEQAIKQACQSEQEPWQAFGQYLCLADQPEPDLFIRTAGVQRISNFLLWDLAYSELYFTSTYWPDFNADEFNKAIAFYQAQERRFGLTSTQVEQLNA